MERPAALVRSSLAALFGALSLAGCATSCLVLRGELGSEWLVVSFVVFGLGLFVTALEERSPRRRAVMARFFPEIGATLSAARAEVVDAARAKVVALLRCHVRPHGGTRWARVDLAPGPPARARVEAAFMGLRWEEDPVGEVARRVVDVPAEAASRVAELVAATSRSEVARVDGHAVDGLPFELAIVGPGADDLLRVEGNLAGLDDAARARPAAALCVELLALIATVTERRSISGAVDGAGTIRIAEV